MAQTFSREVKYTYNETVVDQHFYIASMFRFVQVREVRILGNVKVFR